MRRSDYKCRNIVVRVPRREVKNLALFHWSLTAMLVDDGRAENLGLAANQEVACLEVDRERAPPAAGGQLLPPQICWRRFE